LRSIPSIGDAVELNRTSKLSAENMTSTDSSRTSISESQSVEVAAVPRRHGPLPRTVLAIASLGSAAAFVDATIVNIAFPSIEHSFSGTSISSLSWVLNAYNIVFAAFLVAAGRIADLLGRRRMFVAGIELFTLASVLCAISPSPGFLIGMRVVQALGAALVVPASLALVLEAFPPEKRAHGVALLSAVSAAAAGFGPALGGLLVTAVNWRLVFLVNLPVGICAALLARRHLVESRSPGRRRMPDLFGALLFALSVGSLVLGIVEGQDWGWSSPRIIGAFVLAVVLGAVFVWRCSWHRSPIIELSLLHIRTFTTANAMTLVAAAGFFGYTLTNVLFLTHVWHYSVLQAGLSLTPGPFVAAAIAGPTSRLVERIGHRPVLVAGGLIWGGAVLWLVERVGTTPQFLTEWLPGIILLGIGAGTLFPNVSSAAVASAPGSRFATATSLNAVARQMGAALGVAVVVVLIGNPSPAQAAAHFDHAWTFGSICLLLAGLGCMFVARLPRDETPALADAAREVMHEKRATEPQVVSRPRARRAITVDIAKASPRSESTEDFLSKVPLFAGLDHSLLEQLAHEARTVRLGAGEWLFREDEPGDAVYVIRAGHLEAVKKSSGSVIRQLGRGDALGELALLSGSSRSASVRATRASELLEVRETDFRSLLNGSPELSRSLNRILATQLGESGASLPTARPLPATVAVVAFGDRIPIVDIAHRLSGALEPFLSATVLDGEDGGSQDPGGTASTLYGPLLDRAESSHDMVLLAATMGGSGESASAHESWNEFCVQQADRILLFTSGGGVPELVGERPELLGCDMVGYHVGVGDGLLEGWAEALEPVECHVVREHELEADLARMARRLSGRSVGVVLSGGGARAFSHIGVLEELVAAGVRIDRVVGVSMGAFIGGLFALGMDAEEIDLHCFDEWVQRRPLRDYTLPRHSLIRGNRVWAMLHKLFGTAAIEELACSFMCGYTELRSGQLVVARHGPMWEHIGFSMSLPVIAPPSVRGRELFVDGSLINNLPVETMADLREGPVIAVDVKASFNGSGGSGAQGPKDNGHRPETSRRPRVPSLGETLVRVLLLGSANTSDAAARYADLVIEPRAEGVGLLEFHQLDTAREAGRRAAREALETAPSVLFS
jgi:NTE family protein